MSVDLRYQTGVADVLSRRTQAIVYQQILAEVAQAQRVHGVHDNIDVAQKIRALNVEVLLRDWSLFEAQVKHETAGFVRAVRGLQLEPQYRPFVYLGMTSSDLIDTAAAIQWKEIWRQYIYPDLERLIGELITAARNLEPKRMGRTHGRLAEPVSIGAPYTRAVRDLSNVKLELDQDRPNHPIPGKLSGPVGAYNKALTPTVAYQVAHALGIQLDGSASQIVDRHFYRRVAGDLIEIIAVCEQLATLHRLSAIEGVDLFAESFEDGVQMGSSVMPFKRNPIVSERICGLARVARGHYVALLETWSTSWWERDLTNSSVERIAWWDLVQLCHYLVRETHDVVESGHWRIDVPADYRSRTDELIERQRGGEDPETTYRDIQCRIEVPDDPAKVESDWRSEAERKIATGEPPYTKGHYDPAEDPHPYDPF